MLKTENTLQIGFSPPFDIDIVLYGNEDQGGVFHNK